MIKKENIASDKEGRELIKKVIPKNPGYIIDIGPANAPLHEDAITVDFDSNWNPDFLSEQDDLPFDNEEIDMIVSSHCLEHTINTRKTLNEWYRVLKKGGKVAICVPHGEYLPYHDLGDGDMTHEQLYTGKTLEIYFKHAGFKNVKMEEYDRNTISERKGIFIYAKK